LTGRSPTGRMLESGFLINGWERFYKPEGRTAQENTIPVLEKTLRMLKKCAVSAVVFALAAGISLGVRAAGEDAGQAKKLLQEVLDAYEDIDSHSYTWRAEGMDTFTKERQKQMTGNYDSLAKRAGVKHDVDEEPKLTRGKYEIEFMKPYLQQMKVIRSDFTPKIVWGTLITYRSDKNQDIWWAKPKISPIAIKRSVKDDDAGGALTSNWTSTLLGMIFYAHNASLSVQPDAEFDGRPCHLLRYVFDWEGKPELDRNKPPFDKFQVPSPIQRIMWDGMLEIEDQKITRIDYFIDREKLVVLQTEKYINGEFHWRNSFVDIEINTLTEKDF